MLEELGLDSRAEVVYRLMRMYRVYLASARNDPAALGYARWLTEHGGEVRTAPASQERELLWLLSQGVSDEAAASRVADRPIPPFSSEAVTCVS